RRTLAPLAQRLGVAGGGTHLRARTAGVGVAPEFMPKRNRARIDICGRRADDSERPESGELRDQPRRT
ncbi:MAG: hypothetical protein ACRDPA_03375, partial [Solirubrobacteraceae bacterium]